MKDNSTAIAFQARTESISGLADSLFESEGEMLREARWAAMHGLYHAAEVGLSEDILLSVFRDLKFPLMLAGIRNALIELEELGLCQFSYTEKRAWISPKGVDVHDYKCAAPDCIARPEKLWW